MPRGNRIALPLVALSVAAQAKHCTRVDVLQSNGDFDLSKCTTLEMDGLGATHLGDESVQKLARVLATNTELLSLKLVANDIGDAGAMALAEALGTNAALTSLDLRNNLFGEDAAKMLVKALKTNSGISNLDLRGNLLSTKLREEVHSLLQLAQTRQVLMEAKQAAEARAAAAEQRAMKAEALAAEAMTGLREGARTALLENAAATLVTEEKAAATICKPIVQQAVVAAEQKAEASEFRAEAAEATVAACECKGAVERATAAEAKAVIAALSRNECEEKLIAVQEHAHQTLMQMSLIVDGWSGATLLTSTMVVIALAYWTVSERLSQSRDLAKVPSKNA